MLRFKSAIPVVAALLCALVPPCLAADGQPDPGFGFNGIAYITPDDVEARELRPYDLLELPDGKLLIAGERNQYVASSPHHPHMRAMLARMNADGSPDTGFGNIPAIPGVLVLPDLVPDTGAGIQVIEAMHRLDDGSILVTGTAHAYGPTRGFVVKLHADGSIDAGFGNAGIVLLPDIYLHALAIDSQQRIVVAGEKWISAMSYACVVRLSAGGVLDTGFGTSGAGIVVIDWDGVPSQPSTLSSLALTPDDRILVGGSYEADGAGMGSDFAIARLDSSGAFDPTFAGTGRRVFPAPAGSSWSKFNGIDRMLLTESGAAVFVGHYNDDDTGINILLGRIGADGAADASFGTKVTPGYSPIDIVPESFTRYPTGLARQADGKLVVSARYVAQNKADFIVLRTSAEGALDPGFADGGVLSVDVAPDGDFSDTGALILDSADRPIVAGVADRSTSATLYELAVLRVSHDSEPADRVFANGFD